MRNFIIEKYRSLPKLSSQDEEGGAGHGYSGGPQHFEPIPHDHDFCERVVINVSNLSLLFKLNLLHKKETNRFVDDCIYLFYR